MELFSIVHALALLFTILSALLVAVILGVHLREDLRLRQVAAFRRIAEPLVKNYLAGNAPLTEATAELKKEPRLALSLLLELSEAAGPKELKPLRDLGQSMSYLASMRAGLQHGDEAVRLQNAHGLGYLRDESAIPDLMKALEDKSPKVRLTAAQSLALLGCPDAVKKILLNPEFSGEMPRERVVEVLVQFGAAAVKPVVEVLEDPQTSGKTLAIAVQTCGMLHAQPAVPRLVEILQHKSPQIRLNAVCALAAIGSPKAITPIARLAEDPDPDVKSDVMFSLGILEAADQIPLVVRALNDPTWGVRLSAAQALEQMGQAGRKALEAEAGRGEESPARNVSRQVLQEQGHDWSAGRILA